MALKEQLQAELKAAMKSGDTVRRDVLRMLDSAVKNVEIEKNKRAEGLSEEEILEVAARLVKQRQDSVRQFTAGGRADLAEKEENELEILKAYLPEQLEEAELEKIIVEIISQTGASSPSELGKVMGAAMAKVKGKAEGNLVREKVLKLLNGAK